VDRHGGPGDARRADQHIDLAERGSAGLGGRLDRGGIGDVERLHVGGADFVLRGGERFGIEIPERYGAAFLDDALGDGLAEP